MVTHGVGKSVYNGSTSGTSPSLFLMVLRTVWAARGGAFKVGFQFDHTPSPRASRELSKQDASPFHSGRTWAASDDDWRRGASTIHGLSPRLGQARPA